MGERRPAARIAARGAVAPTRQARVEGGAVQRRRGAGGAALARHPARASHFAHLEWLAPHYLGTRTFTYEVKAFQYHCPISALEDAG
jgi:hypothetical protein